jgi:hypothetical protein
LPADKPYEINALRIEAQQKAWPEYEQFLK